MDRIFSCIDGYMKELEDDIMSIVSDESIPLERKNMMMEPISDQKKILVYTKEALLVVKNKEYTEGCGMSKRMNND